MKELILSPIPIDVLMGQIQQVVRAEIESCTKQQMGEKLLSTKEACKLFEPAITPATLYNWCNSGYVARQFINNRFYYKYTDVMNAAKTLKRYRRNEL